MNNTVGGLLLLHAETPLHPGTGSSLGTVDLPVARERHTGWPLVPGSSLKGVLRDRCLRTTDARDKVAVVFGPDRGVDTGDHAGSLAFSDARLLAFPVRSLRGLYAWVLCPALLDRLMRDLRVAGVKELAELAMKVAKEAREHKIDGPDSNRALVSDGVLVDGNVKMGDPNMVLEEFDFVGKTSEPLKMLGEWIDGKLGQGARVAAHLALISDDAFTHYTRFATEVTARIAIDSETKTVEDHALFYEEFLPSGIILYSLLVASMPTKKDPLIPTSAGLIDFVKDSLGEPPIIQVGANATTGKGLCHAVIIKGA